MARITVNRGVDGDHAYTLEYEPGAKEAKLVAGTLTPRLADELAADLAIFRDQGKRAPKRRAVKAEAPAAAANADP